MGGFLVGVLLVLLDFDDLEPELSLELFLVVGVLVFIILSGGNFFRNLISSLL